MKLIASLAAAGLVSLTAAAPAGAQQKTFTLGGYGGSFEQTMRKDVIPAFEAKHNVKVEYVAGNSTDTLAKLQAQKGNQVIDAIILLQKKIQDQPHKLFDRQKLPAAPGEGR